MRVQPFSFDKPRQGLICAAGSAVWYRLFRERPPSRSSVRLSGAFSRRIVFSVLNRFTNLPFVLELFLCVVAFAKVRHRATPSRDDDFSYLYVALGLFQRFVCKTRDAYIG